MFSFASQGIPSFGDLAWKQPVSYALLAVALPANTLAPAGAPVPGQTMTANANGALAGSAAFWIAPTVGDRVLVRGEASPGNGIWVVTNIGSVGTKWILTRATDANTPAKLPAGAIVMTQTGGTDGNGGRALFEQGFQYGGWQSFPDEIAALTVNGAMSVGGVLAAAAALTAAAARPGMTALPFVFSGSVTGTGDTVLSAADFGTVMGATRERYDVPWAGRIVGVSLRDSANWTAGTLIGKPTIAGAAVASPTATIDGTHLDHRSAVSSYAGATSFAADAAIGMIATGAAFTPVANNLLGVVYVVFDAVG